MHNGCLLLLAFVAVFQPIASYTERGLIDGKQRCDYRTSVRDPELNFHGTYRFAKPAVEDRRLNRREDIRDVRRNAVREDSLRTASSSDRRLAGILERDRNTLKGPSRDRIGNDAVLGREVREARFTSYRDERNQEIRRERVAIVQKTHQARSPIRREHSRGKYDNNYQGGDRQSNEDRYSVESRLDTRSNENNVEAQRVGQHRENRRTAINRVRDDATTRLNERRLTSEGAQRMDIQRSASRIQLDGNTDHEILGRRSRDGELRSSSMSRSRLNRAYNDEYSRMATRDETTSLDRYDRRISSFQRSVDERRQMRDISRIRITAERNNNLETTISRMNLRDRASENRREARLFERVQATESQKDNRDTEGKARLKRTVRSVDDRISQDNVRDSRMFARERSPDNRREVRDAPSMERFRSLERSTEYRKDSRSSDENRREIRNIETGRDNRHTERDSSEARGETRNSNRDTCIHDREQSTKHRMARLARGRSQENRRVARNVESRAISTDRVDESRRVARNSDLRSFNTERAELNRRDTRNYAESRVFRIERTDESRRDNRNLGSRAFRTERPEQIRKDARNADSRLLNTERADQTQRAARTVPVQFRTERTEYIRSNGIRVFGTERAADSRRNAQDFERQSRSLDRDIDYRRDSRNVRDARLYERSLDRNIRSTELRTEDERVANNRRAARSVERETRTIGRERTMTARDSRTYMLERRSEDLRERSIEIRRKAQNTLKELRTTQEGIRVESKGINLVRSRDDLAQRNNDRAIERLSKRDSLENRHSSTLQRESRRDTQRTSERDNLAARLRESEARNGYHVDFTKKRQFQAMLENPTYAENETPSRNWQYIFYTVQALYIGGLLMQLNKRSVGKKTRVSWWSPQHLIKVE